jgi:prepilin-type N-terminal cleavage/methylation domain-containing protein
MSRMLVSNTEPLVRPRRRRLDARGFTMPELLLVLAVLLVMTAGAFLLLRPRYYTAENLRAERRVELAVIAQALQRYRATNGHLPDGLPAEARVIGSGGQEAYDLCRVLVPDYIQDMPLDPQIGLKYQGETPQPESGNVHCNDAGVEYLSGYTVQKIRGGVKLAAPLSGKDALAITVR